MRFEAYFQDYFDPKQPVCREERQYAFIVAHRLMNGDRSAELLDACGIGRQAKIHGVVYEAAFMRDLFCREREDDTVSSNSFNRKLREYVGGIPAHPERANVNIISFLGAAVCPESVPENRNLGGKNKDKQGRELWKKEPYEILMGWMMNAKPDIAITYSLPTDNSMTPWEKRMKFIECKYLSDESPYHTKPRVVQTDIQDVVGKFLCRGILADTVTFDEVWTLKFRSNANRNCKKPAAGGIYDIEDLLRLQFSPALYPENE